MRRSHVNILLHFAWATRNRAPLIPEQHAAAIHDVLRAEAIQMGSSVLAVGGLEDHVHILLAMPATLSAADSARRLKSVSSVAAKRLGLTQFGWQDNYGVTSVSPHDKAVVVEYIKNQREHHRTGKLMPGAELFWQEIDRLAEESRSRPPSRADEEEVSAPTPPEVADLRHSG